LIYEGLPSGGPHEPVFFRLVTAYQIDVFHDDDAKDVVCLLFQITSALTSYVATTTAFFTDEILPLTTHEFEGYMAPVPAHSRRLLDAMYNFDQCLSPFHNHRIGVGFDNVTSVHCKQLKNMYPIYGVEG
jgi:hypothetical protein